MMTRLALFVTWLLHWLPFPLLAACGRALGRLFFRLGRERRQVTLVNLGLCFPHFDEAKKWSLARRHFEFFGRSILERGLLWWASPQRICRHVSLEGRQHLDGLRGRQLILLAPHFVGLDAGWTRLTLEREMVSLYSRQKNPVFDAVLRRGRIRFGQSLILPRTGNSLAAIRAMRSGKPLYYLPDLDHGPDHALFARFFGVPAATLTGLPRLARLSDALVLPAVTRMTPTGYVLEIGAPWPGYPGGDLLADLEFMNRFIEQEIMKMPEQYYWLHKRFKTRPPGELKPY